MKTPFKFLLGFLGFNLVLNLVLLLCWWSDGGLGGETRVLTAAPLGGCCSSEIVTRPVGFYEIDFYLTLAMPIGFLGGIITGCGCADQYDPEKERKQREYWRKEKPPQSSNEAGSA